MTNGLTKMTRRYRFCASHRLHSESLSEAENQRVFGKCNNPYGHGHDYVLDVAVTGELNATTGLIVRLSDLDRLVKTEILAGFSYRNLNQDVAEFTELVPTTENVALVIAERLSQCWADYFPYSSARLSGISMQETERNSFEVVISKTAPPVPAVFSKLNESVIVNA
jgi:6-pyruvoyltetrahydropterin/6-carboxytetrahydropterin synthase